MDKKALRRAIEICGNQSRLADQLGVKPGHVWFWLHRAKKLPPEVAIGIEGVTGGQVRRHELRPDIFDPPEAAA